jgi:hypothetical protein
VEPEGRGAESQRKGATAPCSWTPEEPQVETYEYQDNANIHCQPFPESVSEEHEIYTNDEGYHGHHVKHGSYLSAHFRKTPTPASIHQAPDQRASRKVQVWHFGSPTATFREATYQDMASIDPSHRAILLSSNRPRVRRSAKHHRPVKKTPKQEPRGLALARCSFIPSRLWQNKFATELRRKSHHFLYFAVWNFGRRRQRHGWRRNATLFEESFDSGRGI